MWAAMVRVLMKRIHEKQRMRHPRDTGQIKQANPLAAGLLPYQGKQPYLAGSENRLDGGPAFHGDAEA